MLRPTVREVWKSCLEVVDVHRISPIPPRLRWIANTQLIAGELATHTGGDELVTFPLQDGRAVGVTQSRCLFHDALEHGIEVARVGADQLQDLGGRGLEFERLRQVVVAFLDLAEETGVLDGDRSLVGERFQECDLFGGVPAGVGPAERDDPDHLSHSDHRHGQRALVRGASRRRVGKHVGRLLVPVPNVDDFAGECGGSSEPRSVDRPPPSERLWAERLRPGLCAHDQIVAVAHEDESAGPVTQSVRMIARRRRTPVAGRVGRC